MEWNKLICRLFWGYDAAVPSSGSATRLVPTRHSAWLVRRGHVKVSWPGQREVSIGKGFWVFPPLAPERNQVFSRDARILSLCFQAEWPWGQLFPLDRLISVRASSHPELEEAALDLLKFIVKGVPAFFERGAISADFQSYLKSQERFWRWLSLWADVMTEGGMEPSMRIPIDSRVESVIRILDGLPFTDRIPYETLERAACLGRVQIDRLFVKSIGMTPRKYSERKVLEEAKYLLHATGHPIKEVGSRLGFSSSSHFCAWFRKRIGTYPSEFRGGVNL